MYMMEILLQSRNNEEKKAGYLAKKYLESLIGNKIVRIVFSDKKDKFGRLLGTIFYKRKNINKQMIDEGHAVPYYGDKKQSWEDRTEYMKEKTKDCKLVKLKLNMD